MLSQYSDTGLLKGVAVPDFLFDMRHYTKARDDLGLALIQDFDETPAAYPELRLPEGTLGDCKDPGRFNTTRFVQLAAGEGEYGTFTILQPSYEDAQGVLVMQTIEMKADKTLSSVLSARAFNALMMVDFWNPIYSWRRVVLMQYVPETASFDPESSRYDLEDAFIANIKKSGLYTQGDRESPEIQFISLLEVELEQHQKRIQTYLNHARDRLKISEGLLDYLTLAESHRRIYRPLPLDEFSTTLPYALNYGPDQTARFEMAESGEVHPLPARGMRLFERWTGTQADGSLAGFGPQIFPMPDAGMAVSLTDETDLVIRLYKPHCGASPGSGDRRRCPN